MAGLENAVVADADQAKAHGLRIVKDLRGMFDDDRVKTYRWQLDNLFPRVTHQLLAGLPPTRVVDVENVVWQEIARETRQIRDSSNRGTYDLDVSAKLGKEAVYVRFADSFTDDGWGASVLSGVGQGQRHRDRPLRAEHPGGGAVPVRRLALVDRWRGQPLRRRRQLLDLPLRRHPRVRRPWS